MSKKQKKGSKLLFYLILLILLTVFCVSAYQVITYVVDAKQQESRYNELATLVEQGKTTPAETGEAAGGETFPGEKPILAEYALLYQMNPHMVGWIKIEGTNISYPVMQTPDAKDYYLYRNFDREYNSHGCIYAREDCDINAPSDNITIYGHHMNDGSMFAELEGYLEKDFWKEHKTICFDTLTEHHTYEIFAAFKTTATEGQGFPYHQFVDAADAAEFDEFVATCKGLAFYDTGLTPEYGDKLICLSTCEYTQTNGRLVVAAVRVD